MSLDKFMGKVNSGTSSDAQKIRPLRRSWSGSVTNTTSNQEASELCTEHPHPPEARPRHITSRRRDETAGSNDTQAANALNCGKVRELLVPARKKSVLSRDFWSNSEFFLQDLHSNPQKPLVLLNGFGLSIPQL